MHTLLIANRGEIARRVIRTARALGWRTVAIHSDLDADALHVREADVAVPVESYLDVDAVVAAARQAGATHVHPGYGFLSERAPFARALADAGITLVGPSGDVMDAMGRKDRARDVAVEAGVPVVPSYGLEEASADPSSLPYPVLVKAAAGGGGKGMRVVRTADEFAEAAAAAAREAAKAFGDDTLLVEKYVESGRHIEVQVMGDTHGTVRHFFERDCSTQRRHQKVLEEAPAPTIDAAQREAITSSAVALARQVGYVNAGTVEFLLDDATGEFYFLEMNTRLQVEHPVTEEVVRLRGERVDLVAVQLHVATGGALDFEQSEVTLEGHSIEARVYAEDSFNGFLPQAGIATEVHWPTGAGVRVDHALESGQEVSTSYDPMLGKIIGWGPDRQAARAALIEALDDTRVFGLTTNTGFLRVLAAGEEFGDAAIDTAWLDRHEVAPPERDEARALGARALAPRPSPAEGPWRHDGFRPGGHPAPVVVQLDQPVEVPRDSHPVPEGHVRSTGRVVEVVHRGQRFVFTRPDPFADGEASAGDGVLKAPMPGTVLAVNVEAGQQVAGGETLGVMEAMKMEHAMKAPFAGTVTEVGAASGDLVKLGATLFVVEPHDPS
ncbi:MAG: ATP-grasp domain-containing protein [Nocardioides sp.]|nr:ATP-grasp domain-containing protein [Nocardioides sp.]